MSRNPALLLVAVLCCLVLLLPPAEALAKKKKKKGKKKKAEEIEQVEAPASHDMFTHIETKDFIGELKVERWELNSNGMKVLLLQDKTSPTVAYHTYFNVGSSDEEEGLTGLAHLFEHMMFKRTDKYDDSHFSKVLEESGSPDLNAWTWLDITAYHASVPKAKLATLVDLEATRMDGLIVDKDQLDAEREVVINERRYRVDNDPEGRMNEQLWALAFEANRYHWPTIGWQKDIESYKVEDCMAFYKRWYAPNNATVVVAGDFEVDETLQLLQDKYGEIPKSTIERLPHGEEPEQGELRLKDMELDAETEMIQLAYKVPELTHADYPALMVLDSILTAGNSSRLDRRLIDTGWAASATGWLPIFQHAGLYEFSVTMRPGKAADAALAVLRNEVADLRDRVVTEEELNRARNQLLSHLYGRLLSNSGRAGFLGFNEIAAGKWTNGLDRIESLRSVTAEDVQRVAQTYFVDAGASAVVGRPKGAKKATFRSKDLPKIPTDAAEELLPVVDRPNEGVPEQGPGEVAERSSMGWTRLMVYDPALPMVWFQVVIPVGSGADPEGKEGLANVTAELLLRGTQDRSRDIFERTLEGLGASVGAGVGADSITISGSALAENWPKVAFLLSEAFEFPAFNPDDLEDLIDEIQAEIVDLRNNDRALGRKFFDEGLFGDHAYGKAIEGTTKSLGSISREDVMGFFRNNFTSQGLIVGLLGNFDRGAGSDLAKLAGKFEASAAGAELTMDPAGPEGRSLWLVEKPGRSQVQIHLGHLAPRPEGAEYAAAWIANEAFGGHGFTARLMSEVREKRGWSYGAYGRFSHPKQLSSYSMWVFPASKDAIPCIKLVLSMYEDFQRDGITEEELSHARNGIVNSSAFFADTPAKRLGYEVRKRTTGYDPLALLPQLKEATLEQVNAAAASVFDPANLFGTIVATGKNPSAVDEEGKPAGVSLKEALVEIFGKDGVEVVPFDRE